MNPWNRRGVQWVGTAVWLLGIGMASVGCADASPSGGTSPTGSESLSSGTEDGVFDTDPRFAGKPLKGEQAIAACQAAVESLSATYEVLDVVPNAKACKGDLMVSDDQLLVMGVEFVNTDDYHREKLGAYLTETPSADVCQAAAHTGYMNSDASGLVVEIDGGAYCRYGEDPESEMFGIFFAQNQEIRAQLDSCLGECPTGFTEARMIVLDDLMGYLLSEYGPG